MKVAITKTGSDDAKAWASSRWEACVLDLDARFPGRNVDDMALDIVTHWALETSWGKSEFNYNLGGIHAFPGIDYFASTDAGVPTNFAAWHTLASGVKGYLDLIQNHYQECWAMVTAMPPLPSNAWYNCLGKHGYYGVRGAYEDARQRLQSLIGDFPAPEPGA